MTYLRTGLVSFSAALVLLGCGGLWRPFLEPSADSPAGCGAGGGAGCDLAGAWDLAAGDGMIANPTPVWINESITSLPDLKSIYLLKAGVAIAVGDQAALVEWKSASGWTVLNNKPGGTLYMAISGNSSSNMWIAGADGAAYSYSGGIAPTVRYPCGTVCPGGLTASWTSPLGNPWVVGLNNGAYRIPEGSQNWAPLAVPSSFGQNLLSIWGTSVADVWIGAGDGSGGSGIFHFDGASFKGYAVPDNLPVAGIWGRSPVDVWAVGDAGLVMHWTGAWEQMALGLAGGLNLNAVAGNNAGEVWAVGDGGIILYYDGRKWQRSASPVQYNLYGVTVNPLDSSPLVVGAKGTALRFAIPAGTAGTAGTTGGV